MNISNYSRKDIGNLGERITAEYLRRKGLEVIDRNVSRKTGEIDVIMREGDNLHFVEVKTVTCIEFPDENNARDEYSPAFNLHAFKIRKVARTSEWYVADMNWEGEWQIDGALVWLRL